MFFFYILAFKSAFATSSTKSKVNILDLYRFEEQPFNKLTLKVNKIISGVSRSDSLSVRFRFCRENSFTNYQKKIIRSVLNHKERQIKEILNHFDYWLSKYYDDPYLLTLQALAHIEANDLILYISMLDGKDLEGLLPVLDMYISGLKCIIEHPEITKKGYTTTQNVLEYARIKVFTAAYTKKMEFGFPKLAKLSLYPDREMVANDPVMYIHLNQDLETGKLTRFCELPTNWKSLQEDFLKKIGNQHYSLTEFENFMLHNDSLCTLENVERLMNTANNSHPLSKTALFREIIEEVVDKCSFDE